MTPFTSTFARTKTRLPRFGVDLVERPDLERRLGSSLLECRLVLLIAAAGYGKTAALARQLSLLPEGTASAWVKLDEEDDLARLLLCIADALEPCDPPWRVAPEALAAQVTEKRGLRAVAAELANTLEAVSVSHGVIALDDLHLIGDAEVFDFLGLLVDMLPDHWTLALATRTEPPLPLARLRVLGELAEYRQQDIALTPLEIRRLCEQHRAKDDGTLAETLYKSTRGWAAGVTLSLSGSATGALRLRPGEYGGRRHLYDYLATEVLDHMPAGLRAFLVRCSVLPELTADRCAAVTGIDDVEPLLEDIEQRSLFVSVLDGETLTLRLHDLFRDFLEVQLRQSYPDEVPLLLKRAAEGESDTVRKINLLLRAGARREAERALADAAPALLTTSDGVQVSRLVELFQADPGGDGPWLAYVRGLWAWHGLEDRALCANMRLAVDGFERQGESTAAQDARAFQAVGHFMIGEPHIARALVAKVRLGPIAPEVRLTIGLFGFLSEGYGGSPEASAAHLAQVMDQLEAGAPAALWHRCVPRIYMLLGREGINPLLRRFAQGALAAAGDADGALRAAAKQLQAWLSLWRADLAEATTAVEALQTEFRWQGHPRALRISLRRLMVAFYAMRGDQVRTREVWRGVLSDQFTFASMHPDWRFDFVSQACWFSAVVDDWKFVRRAMPKITRPRNHKLLGTVSSFASCCIARYALHEQRDDDARRQLRDLVQISRSHDRMGVDASVRIFLAVAEIRTGDARLAWAALAPLVDTVRASGDRAGVLLAGKTLIDELAAASWGDAAPADGVETLEAWSDLARHWRSPTAIDASVKPAARTDLSARELNVVALIAEGHSNKVIARRLELSPHTVKRHVARLLERLDVRSRREAAAWHWNHLQQNRVQEKTVDG